MKIFVNMPVSDLEKSKQFFSKLGFDFNPQFTDEKAACMILGDESFVMLLTHDFFKTFTKKELADATKTTEAIIALSVNSREEVVALVDRALEAGASRYAEPNDHGFMYQDSFADPDGHQWEVFYMDTTAFPQA